MDENTDAQKISRQCAGLAIAAGWIWVDSETNTLPTCGDYPRNVAVIQNVRGLAMGTSKEACAGTPVPQGWRIVGHKTMHNRCEDFPDNVVVVRHEDDKKGDGQN